MPGLLYFEEASRALILVQKLWGLVRISFNFDTPTEFSVLTCTTTCKPKGHARLLHVYMTPLFIQLARSTHTLA
jgi:hypothetical protein